MAQLSDDCFAFDGGLMPVDTALAELRDRLVPVAENEQVSIVGAVGRILFADLAAGRDVPPHDNSAVDGYAVYFDDLADGETTQLPVGGRAAAGHPLPRPQNRGEAVRIFTGAPMPGGEGAGPDTVVMQEDCTIANDGSAETVAIPHGLKRGANRRKRGEDIVSGSTVLSAGHRLRPQDVALAASLGQTELTVYRRLRVGIFSTGDEIYDPGTDLPAGGVYDANRFNLIALLGGIGCTVTDYGIVADNRENIETTLRTAAAENDVLLSSAGMSVGEEDHLAEAVSALGQLHFWKVAIKPGRPVAMGQVGGAAFFGLPGNPAAMMVTFLRIARPALLQLAGARDTGSLLYRVRAGFEYRKKRARREYVRVRVTPGDDGFLVAQKFPRDGAGILTSMVEADGLVELPEDLTQLEAGAMVDFLPFSEVNG